MEIHENKCCSPKRNYNAVDLCKFICAILVVSIHIPLLGASDIIIFNDINHVLKQYVARLAVPLFFIASGFFLYKKTTQLNFSLSYTKKYLRHLLRLYVLWSAIYLPISAYLIYKNHPNGFLYSILDYVKNYLIVGSYYQLWYLNSALLAVIIVSFMLYKKISMSKILLASFALYFIGLFEQSWYGFSKPLETAFPTLWYYKTLFMGVIVTTRNWLFDGFFFISLGAFFAYYDVVISKKNNLLAICFSMLFFGMEFAFLDHNNICKDNNTYLMLVPATFFIFNYIKTWDIPDNPIFPWLRKMSALIFYLHTAFKFIFDILIREVLKIQVLVDYESNFLFLLTLTVTMITSAAIIKFSDNNRTKFLKKLYS